MEYKYLGFYKLVIVILCFDLLLKKFYNFKLVVDYDSFELAEEDVRIHGIWEVKKKVRINIFNNAAKATRNE